MMRTGASTQPPAMAARGSALPGATGPGVADAMRIPPAAMAAVVSAGTVQVQSSCDCNRNAAAMASGSAIVGGAPRCRARTTAHATPATSAASSARPMMPMPDSTSSTRLCGWRTFRRSSGLVRSRRCTSANDPAPSPMMGDSPTDAAASFHQSMR